MTDLTKSPPLAAAKPRRSALGTVGGMAGAALGFAASKAFGMALLFPGVFGLATAAILAKAGPERSRPFRPAVSVLVGHLAWMAAGAVITGTFAPVAIDVVLMAVGAAWLLFRPGLAPAVALAILEAASIAVNGWQLASPEVAGQKALALHLLLRVAVLAGLSVGYVAFRKQRQERSRAVLARTFE